MTFAINTPFIWVLLPLGIAALALAAANKRTFTTLLTSISAFVLALLAYIFPESLELSLGPLTLTFPESLGILGREIALRYEILPFISMIYFVTSLWALTSGTGRTPKTFRPTSLAVTALLTAALGVTPFLYAALLIEAAILVTIPMLSPLGKAPKPGILRYLTLQTLAMPFILLAGWLLSGVEALPPESPLIVQSALILGLGIGLWLSIFPFHSWMPMVNEHSNPVVTSFLQFMIPSVVLFFSLNFLNRYTFLRESAGLHQILQIIGVIMIALGGSWTAFQKNLKRAFGFSVLMETGFSLLALGLAGQGGLNWLLLLMPARALSYWLWGYVLALVEQHAGVADLKHIEGFARRYPILSIGLLLAQLSVAGMPLLAEFPTKLSLLTAALGNLPALGVWGFIGSLGLFLYTLRLLTHLVTPPSEDEPGQWRISEKLSEYLPILIMLVVLILVGLFPRAFLSNILNTLTAFGQLNPFN
jgi:NADH:ubiquinone oxidoreductase subunit 2 (subunit N)